MTYYAELLKDPRWQKRRLEVMQRDNFKCKWCLDEKSTLHVHHLKYKNGLKPWEYPDSTLVCICEGCHQEWTDSLEQILELLATMGSNGVGLHAVYGYLLAEAAICGAIKEAHIEGSSPAEIGTKAHAFGSVLNLSTDEILSACVDGKLDIIALFKKHKISSAWDIFEDDPRG
jgi:hypothetical protein